MAERFHCRFLILGQGAYLGKQKHFAGFRVESLIGYIGLIGFLQSCGTLRGAIPGEAFRKGTHN